MKIVKKRTDLPSNKREIILSMFNGSAILLLFVVVEKFWFAVCYEMSIIDRFDDKFSWNSAILLNA